MSQGALATVRRATLSYMDEADLFLWRRERLKAVIERLDSGNLNSFGRRMGWKDGSYVGQMLRGTRAVSEKLVRKIEAMPGYSEWFNPELAGDDPGLMTLVRRELDVRDVPEHALQTFLETIRNYPPKRKAA